MQSESPIATCMYGWGRVFRLYNDYLEANGACHALKGLTHVRQLSHSVLGIPSARLELYFGERKLVLAGIPEIEDAQKTAAHLTAWLNASHTTQREELAQALTEEVEVPYRKRMLRDQCERTRSRVRIERFRQRSLLWHSEDSRRENQSGRQVRSEESLPGVAVPVCMLPGEQAHYITDAALCGERSETPPGRLHSIWQGASLEYFGKLSSSLYGKGRLYPVLDQGMLILTSRRAIYIGRKCQVMLDYINLLHVSRLRGAIALQADYWHKRRIFGMRHPLECAMYLEYILQRLQERVTWTYTEPDERFEEFPARNGGKDRKRR
jgi:hypothetical protein